ncbi:hypothetical protein AA14_21715, partial [Salmonella enterica]|nr:hypothetical protein [Salmonella enterica]
MIEKTGIRTKGKKGTTMKSWLPIAAVCSAMMTVASTTDAATRTPEVVTPTDQWYVTAPVWNGSYEMGNYVPRANDILANTEGAKNAITNSNAEGWASQELGEYYNSAKTFIEGIDNTANKIVSKYGSCSHGYQCITGTSINSVKTMEKNVSQYMPNLLAAITAINEAVAANNNERTLHYTIDGEGNSGVTVDDERTMTMANGSIAKLTSLQEYLRPSETGVAGSLISQPDIEIKYAGMGSNVKVKLTDKETTKTVVDLATRTANIVNVGSNSTFDTSTNASQISIGHYNTTSGINSVNIGSHSTSIDSVVVGNDSIGDEQSIAVGQGSKAIKKSIAIGANTSSSEGGIALGNDSVATEANELSIGNENGLNRKITHMADGSNDSDGATIHNVKTEISALDGKAQGYANDALTAANKHTDDSITGLNLDDKFNSADSKAQ